MYDVMYQLFVLLVVVAAFFLCYLFVRAMSHAYFRTKLEYLRSVLKELNGGRRNGEG